MKKILTAYVALSLSPAPAQAAKPLPPEVQASIYRPLLYLAVDSGMRPQEYLAISHSALRTNGVFVDRAIEGGGTEISATKTPAGRRFIELSTDTLTMVRHYAENHSVKNEYNLISRPTTVNGNLVGTGSAEASTPLVKRRD